MVELIIGVARERCHYTRDAPESSPESSQTSQNFGSDRGKFGRNRPALVISANSKRNTFGGFPRLRTKTTRPYSGREAVECVFRCKTTTDPRTTQGK